MSAAGAKLSFEPGGEFFRETRDDVERYLGSRAARLRGRLQLVTKSAVAIGLLAGSWSSLVFVRPAIQRTTVEPIIVLNWQEEVRRLIDASGAKR